MKLAGRWLTDDAIVVVLRDCSMKAVRVEILQRLPERVTALETQIVQLRDEMRAEFSATRAEARASNEDAVRTLGQEIRDGDEETRRFMRILHEEVIQRIQLLGGAS